MRSRILLVLAVAVGALALASTASATSWTRLGGDPLVPGGVNTRADFVRVMTSSKANTAMTFAGLNKAERSAVVDQVRRGNFSSCTMRFGQRFWRMSFGIHGTSVDRNVTFADPRFRHGAPAWCVTGVTKGGMAVTVMMPRKCGNVAVPKPPVPVRKIRKVVVPKTPPVAVVCPGNTVWNGAACVIQTQTASQSCKANEIWNGTQCVITQIQVVCGNVDVGGTGITQGGNCNTTTVVPPPPVKPPPPPPPPANQPPTGQLLPPQHVFVNGQAPVCVDNVVDPDGDPVSVSFSFTAGQAISAVFSQPGGARCVMYQAPADPQQVTVTAVLTDGRGGSLTLLDNFPVIPDQF